ncbi:MAG TPA: hypothetical protein VIS96_07505 [Terrimicrobiaceae bacterium]
MPQRIGCSVTGQLPPEALGALQSDGLEGWPDDILRHSYGSYHLAKHRNAALTAEQMGHKNARMLYAHYREVVKETSAIEEYWKLTPELSGKLIRIEAA